MGQAEILEILQKKKEASIKELSETTGAGFGSIWQALMRLAKHGEVERIVIEPEKAKEKGMSKRGFKHIIWRLKNEKK